MKQPSIKHLLTQIVLMFVILLALSPIFRSEMTIMQNVAYSLVGGVILGGLFYFYDVWRSKSKRP